MEGRDRAEAKCCGADEEGFNGGKGIIDARTYIGKRGRDSNFGKGNVGVPTEPFWATRRFGIAKETVNSANTGSSVQRSTKNKYDFIFDKSADVVMLYSEKRHDISELVLRGIARTRKISKPAKKASRSQLDEFEGEDVETEEISEALQERIDQAKAASEAREKTADEKRAEQLKLREERKKAYEERRKKLLEEREAKKKEKQEGRKKDTEEKDDSGNN